MKSAFIPGLALVQRGHLPPPKPGEPGIFAMADPERIRELVTGAGFSEPRIEQVEITWPYRDADDHWSFTMKLAGPLADAVGALDEADQDQIRREVRAQIEPLIAEGGVGGLTHVVTAT